MKITEKKRKHCTAVGLDYYDSAGRRVQKVVGKAKSEDALKLIRKDAEREAKRIEYELAEDKHISKQGEMPIDAALVEFGEHIERSTRKLKTKQLYLEGAIPPFRRFLKDTKAKRLRDVTPKLIIQLIGEMKENGYKSNTIIQRLLILSSLFKRCVERGDIALNPFVHPDVKAITPKGEPHERAFTDAELAQFLDVLRRSKRKDAPAYADFFQLLSDTGLRLGEGRMLRWCDLHLDAEGASYLRVEPHDDWTPKSKKSERSVSISPEVERMLRRRAGDRQIDLSKQIFPERWTNGSASSAFRHHLKAEGMDCRNEKGEKLVIHSLRHYYATTLVRYGLDVATVRDNLGHANFEVTNRYFNVPSEDRLRATEVAKARKSVTKNVTDSSGLYRFPAEIAANSEKG